MISENYKKQVELLLKIIPFVDSEICFALKGGTAINFFIRDLPRLSVDIDLTYLPIQDRVTSIENINLGLENISNKLKNAGFNVFERGKLESKKLEISKDNVSVKIEPNYTLRGNIKSVKRVRLSSSIEEKFTMSASINILNPDEIYAGKICAALDRQHPRDLFDIKLLLDEQGLTNDILEVFIVYLIAHNRPINEILNPNLKDIKDIYYNEFQGMTEININLEELVQTRKYLIDTVRNSLTDNHKKFILLFKQGKPDWKLLKLNNIDILPAVQWKLKNILNMPEKKHQEQLRKLFNVLS